MEKEKNFAAYAAGICDALPEKAKLCNVPVQFLLDFATLCGFEDKPVTFVADKMLRHYLDNLWHDYGVDDLKEMVKNFYHHASHVVTHDLQEEIRWHINHGYTLQDAFKRVEETCKKVEETVEEKVERTKLVVYFDPCDIMDPTGYTEQEIKSECFRVRQYATYEQALDSYANTMCTWSRLLEEDADEQEFIDIAWEHIKSNDLEWLEQNFV